MPAERTVRTAATVVLAATLLGGCRSDPGIAAPTVPHQTWTPPESLRSTVSQTLAQHGGQGTPARNQVQGPLPAPDQTTLNPERAYSLSELIDYAQRHNPATRTAWEEARQAALATGVASSTLLPRLAATVVGGYQRLSSTTSLPLGGNQTLTTEMQGLAPILTVEWLLFDFGERAATVAASRHLAMAANVKFNQAHQLVVFDVSRAFNALAAAERKEATAIRALAAARQIQAAAEARERRGVGTNIEIAQARQLVAQAALTRVQAQGATAAARVALNGALGTPHGTVVHLSDNPDHLPATTTDSLDRVIEHALVRRPDIMASVAQLKAMEAGAQAAAASFLPKVGLIAGLALGENQFRINNSNLLGSPLQQSGVLIGMTMPLFDGGLRDSNLNSARSRVLAAQAAVATVRSAAATEIAAAYEALRTSLAAYHAAAALVAATKITEDAARKGYEVGLGTLTDAMAAEKALLDAENVRTDARRGTFDAAATLAFVTAALPPEAPQDTVQLRTRSPSLVIDYRP